MSSASARTVCEERARRPVSIAELFTIGIGPSSSHTVGPMRAAAQFVGALGNDRKLARLRVKLHGSLALTGRGHHTDRAVIMGLGGHLPAEVNAEMIKDFLASLRGFLSGYDRPVVCIHGDSHYYRIDKPFRDANGKTFLGFTRIEVFGSPNVVGLVITVDPDDPQIFSTRPYYLKKK